MCVPKAPCSSNDSHARMRRASEFLSFETPWRGSDSFLPKDSRTAVLSSILSIGIRVRLAAVSPAEISGSLYLFSRIIHVSIVELLPSTQRERLIELFSILAQSRGYRTKSLHFTRTDAVSRDPSSLTARKIVPANKRRHVEKRVTFVIDLDLVLRAYVF